MTNKNEAKTRFGVMERMLAYKFLFGAQLLLSAAIVIDYSLTNNINHSLGGWFYVLIAAGQILAVLPFFRRWDVGRHSYLVLALAHLMLAVFLIFLTDIFGPYFQILILLLFATIYWLGVAGLVMGLSLEFLIVVVAAWHQYGILSTNLVTVTLIHALVLAILGILFERISLPHRLQAASTEHLLQTVSFERTRLVSLINSMADAVIATNNKGKVLLYNGAALDLLNTNISLEDKLLENYLSLRNDKGRKVNIIRDARKVDAALKRDDLYFVSNEGQKVRLYIDIAPIRSEDGGPRGGGFIMLLRDITREKSLDEERSEFISVTSHELRTPIAIAEANISTALLPNVSGELPENVRKLLEQVHAQTIFLADLVNDLTTLARAERGDLELEIKPVSAKQMLKHLASDYRQEAKDKGLRIILGANLPDQTVNSSELYIQEILQNFLTNAIKYTEKGHITLSAEVGRNGSLVFSVKDTGIGIAASDKKKVFEKFYRAEDYRTRQTRGTGLGLYITRRLAQRLDAKIWFASKLNIGSTFYVEIPPFSKLNQDHPKVIRAQLKNYVESL